MHKNTVKIVKKCAQSVIISLITRIYVEWPRNLREIAKMKIWECDDFLAPIFKEIIGAWTGLRWTMCPGNSGNSSKFQLSIWVSKI
jgi:hypothetical protein